MASPTSPTVSISNRADMSRVKGQNILITGGASGLGLAMFREFAKHGYVSPVPAPVARLKLYASWQRQRRHCRSERGEGKQACRRDET